MVDRFSGSVVLRDGRGAGRSTLEDDEDNGEGEGWEIDQESDVEEANTDLCLVGCFLTATTVNFLSMKTVSVNLWHPLGEVTITDMGEKGF